MSLITQNVGNVEWPPVAFTGTGSTGAWTSATSLGTFVASASSELGGFEVWYAFNKNTVDTGGVGTTWASNNTGTPPVTAGISGNWFQLQTPIAFKLSYITLWGRTPATDQNPSQIYVFGSNNGSTWTNLLGPQATTLRSAGGGPNTFNVNAGTEYTYFRIVCSAPLGDGYTSMLETYFYGTYNGLTAPAVPMKFAPSGTGLRGFFTNQPGLYTFTSFNFTTLSTTGSAGPTSLSGYGGAYPGVGTPSTLTLASGIQYWTVPKSGNYSITAAGAGYSTGIFTFNDLWYNYIVYGAVGTATFTLNQGDVVAILVGQRPSSDLSIYGRMPGCGGSFVYNTTTSTLLCAVGGAGGSGIDNQNATGTGTNADPYTICGGRGLDGSLTTSGGTPPYPSGAGGTDGNGGQGSQQSPPNYYGAAGGGGFLTDGGAGFTASVGGKAYLNGGKGGEGGGGTFDYGGFGGGGSSTYIAGAGGGGGYSGGGGGATVGAGYGGGGGGSYVNPSTSWVSILATNASAGYVTVTKL